MLSIVIMMLSIFRITSPLVPTSRLNCYRTLMKKNFLSFCSCS